MQVDLDGEDKAVAEELNLIQLLNTWQFAAGAENQAKLNYQTAMGQGNPDPTTPDAVAASAVLMAAIETHRTALAAVRDAVKTDGA